ncbi:MAG: cysteine desulfurase family protein [Bdellovibrionota bacterium]
MSTYFDHNATSLLRPTVVEGLQKALREGIGGNPSSVHAQGRKAKKLLEDARQITADFFSCKPSQILFTSGGSESIRIGWEKTLASSPKNILTSKMEHSCVLSNARKAARSGHHVDYIPVRTDGSLDHSSIKSNYDLISLQSANNETGIVHDLPHIKTHNVENGLFLCDAVQIAGKAPISFSSLGFDLMTLAGHKLGALGGIGALIFEKESMITPVHEGSQERGLRAGTENVLGAWSLALSLIELSESGKQECQRIETLRDEFETQLMESISDIHITGKHLPRLGNTSHIKFDHVDGESLVTALDVEGFCVSMGAACSSGTIEPSHVLLAMGLSSEQAKSCLRFSFGWNHKESDIEKLLQTLPRLVERTRKASLT